MMPHPNKFNRFFFLVIYLFVWYAGHVLHSFNMVGEFDGFLKGLLLFNLELSYALFQGCNLAGGGNSVCRAPLNLVDRAYLREGP
jgi:hypothetical protein